MEILGRFMGSGEKMLDKEGVGVVVVWERKETYGRKMRQRE